MLIQLQELATPIKLLLAPQLQVEQRVADLLRAYAPEKAFKRAEYVGALGEVYAKLLFGGQLVDDSHEHDLVDRDGRRISVKTRRGKTRGWEKTSAISSVGADGGPEDLVFISLHEDYTPRKIWRYDWAKLLETRRFKEHIVREQLRSFVFFVSERDDADYVCFESAAAHIEPSMDEASEAVTIDLAKVRAFVHGSDTPAYRMMHEMNRVVNEEGMEGHRGAPRALLHFVEELVAHCRA